VLAARRGAQMRHPGKWEFPGGKLEEEELPEDGIIREIMEELGIRIRVVEVMQPSQHSYPDLELTLLPFLCEWIGDPLVLREHDGVRWLSPNEVQEVDWADADLPVVKAWAKLLRD
jgi:8-oxo-dGTP diphosphatase